jgi:hypothetical protein
MTAAEILLLYVWIAAALFLGWQLGALIGYWSAYGWPWTRKVRRWAARRHRKEAEAALARWAERHPDEAQRIGKNLTAIAQLGMTSVGAIEAFAALARELRGEEV